MHDRTEFAGGEKLAHWPALDDVELVKEEPGARTQALEARLLEPDVVVVVQIVDADDFVSAIEQVVGQGCTDESGGAGDKNLHFRLSSRQPCGFMLCQRHVSRHMSSRVYVAFQPSIFSASDGSARSEEHTSEL